MAHSLQHNKKILLKALEESYGNVSKACRLANLNRSVFYELCKKDSEFKELVDEMNEVALDFSEEMLFENIKSKKEASIIFHLKTKGKSRGYIERSEQEVTVNKPIILDFERPYIPTEFKADGGPRTSTKK